MRFAALAILVLLSCAGPALAQHASETRIVPRHGGIGNPVEDAAAIRLGNCRSSDAAVDLGRMMVLENERLEIDGEGGRPTRVALQGGSVRFEHLDGDRGSYGFSIGDIVGGDEPLDVELRLALAEGQLAIFWRETFQHRIYRQGLLKIVGGELVRWCEGRGGVTSSPSIVERTVLD